MLISLLYILSAALPGCDSGSSGLPTAPLDARGTATTADSDEPDRAALVALYKATDGPDWVNNGNWLSDRPLSEWYGVTTDELGYVTELWLRKNNVGGTLPPELGQLSRLKRLLLDRDLWHNLAYSNELTGEIPAELGNLSNLEELNLTDNDLSGEIPVELSRLSNLKILSLSENQLTGEIPAELADLSMLEELNLRYNDLSGEIPAELARLSNLLVLRLDGNELTGGIPAELAELSNLLELELDNNALSGEIPAELAHLTKPAFLDLIHDDSTGEATPELAELTDLLVEYLFLYAPSSYIEFFGGIHAEPGQLSRPEVLALWNNALSVETPATLGKKLSPLLVDTYAVREYRAEDPVQLEWLFNRLYNMLSGLERLKLANNALSGCVPAAFRDVENNDFDELGLPFC